MTSSSFITKAGIMFLYYSDLFWIDSGVRTERYLKLKYYQVGNESLALKTKVRF